MTHQNPPLYSHFYIIPHYPFMPSPQFLELPFPPHCSFTIPRITSCSFQQFCAMLEGKAIIGETDMFQTMQQDALRLAAKALDVFDVIESTEIAHFIKKDFDSSYGPGWQCIVGTDFGSFVTHCHGCFIYFCIGSLTILLFRGAVGPAAKANLFPASEAVKA